jgi:hypothetical protein
VRPVGEHRQRRGLLGEQVPRDIVAADSRTSPASVHTARVSAAGDGVPAAAPEGVAESSGWRPEPLRDLRPLNVPSMLRVQLDQQGRPMAVWRRGRRAPRMVEAVQDRWRIDDEWWREHAISRMYYRLLLSDGSLLVVYHDLLRNTWFEQRA